MRILFAAIAVPYPPTHGQRLRNWALLRALHEEGHEVTLVAFATTEDVWHATGVLHDACREVRFVPLPYPGVLGRSWARLRALPSHLPQGVLKYRSPEMRAEITECLNEGVDAAICDDLYMFDNFPVDSPAVVILNKHDLLTNILSGYAHYHPNAFIRAYARGEARKVEAWERRVVEKSGAVMCCSPADRDLMVRQAPSQRFTVVPNAIDAAACEPAPDPGGATLIYSGSMAFYPNRDAIEHFLWDIFPAIQQRVPEVRLLITGPPPERRFIRYCKTRGNIEFTGFVSDIRKELASANVAIVPLRIGSGTRLKILEAAAMERPVVSTTLGAEGLAFTAEQEIVLRDSPEQFAAAVADLLGNPMRRAAIGAAARRRVIAEYSLPTVKHQLYELLSACATRGTEAAAGGGTR